MTKLDALNEILTNKLDSEKGASVLDAINNASKSYNGADNATSIAEALKNLSDVFEKGGEGGKLPNYEGATDVTPTLEGQTLATANKSVNSDITVKAIEPLYEDGVNVVDAVTDEATTATKTTSKAITNKSSKVYVRPAIKFEGWYKVQDGDTQTEIQIDEAEQAKIVAENIKKGVSILGVEGTLDEQGGKLPDYEGATEVTPSLEEQTLATANKSVNSDITVKAIAPVYDNGANVVDAVTDEATTATKTTSKAITNKSSKVYVRPAIKSEGWYKEQDGDTQTEIQIDEAEQAKIVAENIKKGVSILGVEGTLDEQGGKLPDYEGATDVTPSLEEQTLATANKSVNSDIIVRAISPVYDDRANELRDIIQSSPFFETETVFNTDKQEIAYKDTVVYVRPTVGSTMPQRNGAGWYKDGTKGDRQIKAYIREAEQAKIVAENIKKGVSILGVEGTFEGEDIPEYTGATEVTPSLEEQTLATANKSVNSDITVKAIEPIYDDGKKVYGVVGDEATTATKTIHSSIREKAGKKYIRPKVSTEGWYKVQDGDTQIEIQIDEAEQAKIVAENIRKGVSILGVEGTLDEQGGKLPDYEGATEVTPSLEEQTLATANKSVNSDITVKAITVRESPTPYLNFEIKDTEMFGDYYEKKNIALKDEKFYLKPYCGGGGYYRAGTESSRVAIFGIDEAEQAKIVAENIKYGVSILGAEGVLIEKYPNYLGATEVTPTLEEQTLATAGKSVNSDITVKAIEPVYASGVNVVDAVTDEATTATITNSKTITNKSSKVYVRPTIKSEGWYKAQDGDTQTEIQIDEAEQAKIVAENIKKGVSILGVVGTLDKFPDYEGDRVVYPSLAIQTLATKDKSLYSDITVREISPVFEDGTNVVDAVTDEATTAQETLNKYIRDKASVVYVRPSIKSEGWYKVQDGDTQRKIQIAPQEQEKIIPTNIKKGVSILGVEGTLEGGTALTQGKIYDSSALMNNNKGWIGALLSTVDISALQFSSVYPNFSNLFYNCVFIENAILCPNFEISGATSMFMNCSMLQNIKNIETLDVSRVTDFSNMFYGCSSLTTLDLSNFNTANGVSSPFYGMFSNCTNLENITWGEDWGAGLTRYYSPELDLSSCSKLTHVSALDLINKLADKSAEAETSGTTHNIRFALALQSSITDEEKAIATAKGWDIQFA